LKSHHLPFFANSLEESAPSGQAYCGKQQETIEQLANFQPDKIPFNVESNSFSPIDHLINNWRGESILSTHALIIKKALGDLN